MTEKDGFMKQGKLVAQNFNDFEYDEERFDPNVFDNLKLDIKLELPPYYELIEQDEESSAEVVNFIEDYRDRVIDVDFNASSSALINLVYDKFTRLEKV